MIKVLIGVPTFENVYTETFKSIYDLKIPGGVDCNLEFVKGYDCARARNLIMDKAHENDKPLYDYVFMVDSDIILPENSLELLLMSFDIVHRRAYIQGYKPGAILGAYPRKDGSNISDVFKLGTGYPNDNKLSIDEINNLGKSDDSLEYIIRVNGGGFGCALIDTEIFNFSTVSMPYFNYVNYPDGNVLSEDLYFCSALRNAGYGVYLNTKVVCKHIGKKTY